MDWWRWSVRSAKDNPVIALAVAAILPAAAFYYFLGLTPQSSYVLGVAVTVAVSVVSFWRPGRHGSPDLFARFAVRGGGYGSPDVFGFAVLCGAHGPCDLYFRYDYEHRSERWEWWSPKGEVLARSSLHEALMALRNRSDCTKLEDLSAGPHRYDLQVVNEEKWELWHDSGNEWTWYKIEAPNSLSDAKSMLTRSSLHEALEALRDYPGRGRALT